ncbi:hypothetical protein [Usitatibacter palustris]|uniref:Uncharacterized protein n=1 Tax=Usitatibacter palustris TaxID=2732487 RepID=A0A6M4H8V0_9PROT|nr:hypothetical protein [Usitatibacter palustris]QJR15635.1 hypothetical protein DSM104440_02457 [Usitatibacter palustris]
MLKRQDDIFDREDEGAMSARDREHFEQIAQGRTTRVAMLVGSLVVVYSGYLYWAIVMPPTGSITFSGLLGRIVLIALVGGIPFFVMVWYDPTWRSRHAATITLCTWFTVFMIFAMIYNTQCPKIAAFLFIPLTLGALVGHNLGMFRHPETFDPQELDG